MIVDDDCGFRGLVSVVLEGAGYAVFEASTGEEALALVSRQTPRLVLLDVCLPGLSGYEVCRTLREDLGEELAIVFVSGERIESLDRAAGLLLGADDYLAKPFVPDELLARVRRLLRRSAPTRANGNALTGREREVLSLLAEGLGQRQIAERLFVSPKTVGTHVAHLFKKLGVHSRAEAVSAAHREQLL